MQTLHAQLQRDYPRPPALVRSIRVVSLQDKLTEGARFSLLVLQGAVGFVLLIAVANVANLLLAQASLRTRETAIRAALGAGRGRLMLQFLVESVVLALIAGTTGVVVAYTAVPLLVSLAPFSVTGIADIAVDGRRPGLHPLHFDRDRCALRLGAGVRNVASEPAEHTGRHDADGNRR